jgi:hypothetical protein
MIVRVVSIMLCLFVASLSRAELPVSADEPKTFYSFLSMGTGYANNLLANDVLRPNELDRWARILNASEAQAEFMRIQYEQFVHRHNDVMDREAPRYLELSAQLSIHIREEGIGSQVVAEVNDQLSRLGNRFRSQLEGVEREFIDSLAPVLTEEQRPRLEILRLEATRRQFGFVRNQVRWADIELRRVWEAVDPSIPSPREIAAIERILLPYEIALTNDARRQADAFSEMTRRLPRYHFQRTEGTITFAEFLERHDRVLAGVADASRRIASLNVRTLEQIEQAVSKELSAMIWQLAREEVFPELYPDGAAIHELFDKLANDHQLGEEIRVAVVSLGRLYSAAYEEERRSIEAFCVDWGERGAAGEVGYAPQNLLDALEPLLEERTELSRRWLVMLVEHVGIEALNRHAAAIPAVLRPIVDELTEMESVSPE